MKKIIAISLIASIMIGGLTGCNSNNNSTDNSTSTEISTEESTKTDTETSDENKFYEDELMTINVEGKNINIMGLDGYNYSIQEFNGDLMKNTKELSFEVKEPGYGFIDILVTSDGVDKLYDISVDIDENLNIDLSNVFVIDNNEISEPQDIDVSPDLLDIIDTVYNNIDKDLHPEVMTYTGGTAELEYNVGIDSLEGLEEYAVSDPMMSSIAYSLVVLKFDTKENAEKACPIIKENAPINKWVCVSADEVSVKTVKNNYCLLIMGPKDTVEAVNNVEIN